MNLLFPFPEIRNGQKELMQDVENVLESGRTLIAHAPTGIGKTAAVLAPALDYALKNNKTVLFLTSKQSQHRIVIDTLRLIKEKNKKINFSVVDIISKQAMCPRDIAKEHYVLFNELCIHGQKTKTCRYFRSDKNTVNKILENIMHVEELKKLCEENILCPYKAAIEAIAETDVVICDYNYVFTDILETILEKMHCSLKDIILIIDEAHNIPDRIRDNLSGELTLSMIEDAAKEIKHIDQKLYRHLTDIERFFGNFVKDLPKNTEVNVSREDITEGVLGVLQEIIGGCTNYTEFVGELKDATVNLVEKDKTHEKKEDSAIESVAEFFDKWDTILPCSRILSNNITPKISFKLLDPSVMSESIISNTHTTIMMSGTLYPVEMYADILGAKNPLLKEYISPFPLKNRLVLITKKLTTLYAMRSESMYKEIAEKISKIHDAVNGNIAVFFPSYDFMESIYGKFDDINKTEIILEKRGMSKTDKNELYDKLKGNSSKILMGVQAGSLSEGVDYKNNILKAVIIVGLPLSPPKLEVKNLREHYIKKFDREKGELYGYIYPAISKVLQAAGRGIRSEKDVGVIILMDYRFAYSRYRKCLPPDYEIQITDEPEKLCKEFYESEYIIKALEETKRKIYETEHPFEITKEEKEVKFIPEEEIPLKILECVLEFNEKLGKNKIASILTGSEVKFIIDRGYDKSKKYGILRSFHGKDIVRAIDELMEKNYLEKAGDFMYPVVKISEKGIIAVKEKTEIKLECIKTITEYAFQKEKFTPEETELFNKLKSWRKETSQKNNIPSYIILHDKTLKEIAHEMPESKEKLKKIYGIGEAKLEKYGEIILKMVSEHKAKEKKQPIIHI